jgi:hypothetical protein
VTEAAVKATGGIERGSAGSVLLAFLKLGLTSFGGPVAVQPGSMDTNSWRVLW